MSPPGKKSELLHANFNQDNSCIAVGTRKGYSITNCEPFGRVYAKANGPIAIVEMLFCTSLVALVGASDRPASSTRRLQIVNTKRQSTICELTFPTSILAVKLNRKRLVVVLEEQIYVYDISNMKLLHTIETSPNPHAICALSPSSDNSYLAYPSPLISPNSPFAAPPAAPVSAAQPRHGDVLLFDAVSLSVTNIVQAHKTPLSFVALNQAGTLLATSSDKGTVIRVFSVPNGDKIAQFRRGTYPANIYNIAFNAVSTLLAVSSDTETIHIFKLPSKDKDVPASNVVRRSIARSLSDDADSISSSGYEALIDHKRNSSSVGSSLRKKSLTFGRTFAGSVGGYLPNTLTEMWEPQRDFAFLKLPISGVRSAVALSSTTPQVMVVTSEGVLHVYAIDLERGGECVLQKTYGLLDGIEDAGSGLD